MNHNINFVPEGHILLKRNKDIPGVVGKVGTILGECGINIAEYILSRPHKKEAPISIIKVDHSLSQDTLNQLKEIKEIIEIRQFEI